MDYRTLNPATEELLKSFELISNSDLEHVVKQSWDTFLSWRETCFTERNKLFYRLADILLEKEEQFKEIIALEMGRPVSQSSTQKPADTCRYFADHAEEFLSTRIGQDLPLDAEVQCEPMGPVLAIMPWNYPLWQVIRFAAPALMAGNTIIVKHAPNTPQTALLIEEIFNEAGFPAGCFQNIFASKEQVENVIADKRIRALTLTGSVRAGRELAALAGKHLKPCVMELGGSDPFILLDDADLKAAAKLAANSRCANSGQICCASKRMLVPKNKAEEFTKQLVEAMQAYSIGDPLDANIELGPLARQDILDNLDRQVKETINQGAQVLCGGEPLDQKGYYYPPTVLINVPEDSPGRKEELFGPVAVIIPYKDLEEAISIANETEYGLSAVIAGNNKEQIMNLAEKLECGVVGINTRATSYPAVPFGGVKSSGFGNELGPEGIREFVNFKTILSAKN